MTFSISYAIFVKETKESKRKRKKGGICFDDSSTKFKRIYVNKADLRNMWWTRGNIAQAELLAEEDFI